MAFSAVITSTCSQLTVVLCSIECCASISFLLLNSLCSVECSTPCFHDWLVVAKWTIICCLTLELLASFWRIMYSSFHGVSFRSMLLNFGSLFPLRHCFLRKNRLLVYDLTRTTYMSPSQKGIYRLDWDLGRKSVVSCK